MLDLAVQKLNFTVKLDSLKDYYNTLVTDYEHLRWSWDKHGTDITDEWRQRMMSEPGTLLPYGWAIQSNLVDPTVPCPPYNISTHKRCEYRNTELAFGLVTKLQKLMPYTYRWSLAVQPPGGKVSRHVDQGDEYTGHIFISSTDQALFKFWKNNDTKSFNMPADGSVWLVDTIIEHETENYSTNEYRIGLVFRFNRKDVDKIWALTGEVS
jgi:hypothetical protein